MTLSKPIETRYEHIMQPYMRLLGRLCYGDVNKRTDRTGTGTRSLFGYQMRFDLSEGFPLLTGRKLHWKSIVHELLWFLRGDTNIAYLKANGVSIWDEWADESGELGPVYGKQWRSWTSPAMSVAPDGVLRNETIDQIRNVIEGIQKDPYGRRHMVTAWNPADLGDQALPPCHCLFQFYVADGKLSCQLYQRSADMFLGVPFNIASYALLTLIVAKICKLEPGEFVHTIGDAHLYNNHERQTIQLLERDMPPCPFVVIAPLESIDDLTADHITLLDYNPLPAINAPVAV